MTEAKDLYIKSNDLFNETDTALRKLSKELSNVGYDERHKILGKLQVACEFVGKARSLFIEVDRAQEKTSNKTIEPERER